MTVTILFVDHADHRKTGSSDFFRQLLQNNFDVQYRLFDPNINVDVESLANLVASDVIVVLWQVDYLAPIFLSLGLRTIVIPMYDASEHAPDLHWIWSQHASFINFSRSLHDRLRRLGLNSLWVKYFPKPQGKEHRAKFDALRAFLWQRRPEQGINLHTVEKILGDGVKAIHVHDVPDSALTNTTKYLFPTIKSYDLTISSWFENSSKYYEVLEQANVFFAPRRTEGIGLAMLEAISRGMTIFASELPTHDEYIANWVNGVLYSSLAEFRRAEIDLGQAQALGSLALETVADGYIRWVRQEPLIFDFIQSAPRPNKLPLKSVSLFGTGLLHAYRSGGHTYRNYLIANEVLIRETSGFPGTGRFTAEGNYQSTPIVEAPHQVTAALNVPWLESLR